MGECGNVGHSFAILTVAGSTLFRVNLLACLDVQLSLVGILSPGHRSRGVMKTPGLSRQLNRYQ